MVSPIDLQATFFCPGDQTMSMPNTPSASEQSSAMAIKLARATLRWETGAAIFLLAVLQQSLGHHNPDNSWLFHVCERLLDGARIYVDPIETNPPASFLIYLPAAFLARLVHLPVEFTVSLFVFGGALASLWFSGVIARRSKLLNSDERAFAFNAGIVALIALPGICFAQREHVAVISILPMLYIYAARASGGPVRLSHAIVAGLLGGVAVAIKPFFALALLLPLLAILWKQRTPFLIVTAENIACGMLVCLYAASIYVLFPEFFTVLPALLDTYAAVTMPLRLLFQSPFFLLSAALMVSALLLSRMQDDTPGRFVTIMLAAASAGFLVSACIQGKGWINHFLPSIALGLLALAIAMAGRIKALAARSPQEPSAEMGLVAPALVLPAVLLLPMFFGAPNQFAMQDEYPGVKEVIARHAPAHPKIMTLAVGLDAGFPLTRQIGGQWVGRQNMLWQMAFARIRLDSGKADRAKMQRYIDADARMFRDDVTQRKPDIIVAGKGPHIDKIKQHADIKAALAGYRKVADISDLEVWAPN